MANTLQIPELIVLDKNLQEEIGLNLYKSGYGYDDIRILQNSVRERQITLKEASMDVYKIIRSAISNHKQAISGWENPVEKTFF